jgi:SAM-dependent methyltransferase
MPDVLTWQSEDRCVVGGTTFQTEPVDLLDRDPPTISMEGADFLLWKERPLIDRYVELLEELRPRHIVELGVMEGGGTAFLFELAHPRRLVAIDRRPPMDPALRDYVARGGLDQAVRIYDDVDQGNRRRLAEIIEEEFGDEPLDLVVDDCSHMYDPTRASFNELFPRLRAGGLYTIEDWRWAHPQLHDESLEGMWPDQIPLTRLIFELVLAVPSVPGLIAEITVETESVQVRRGEADVDPRGFEISACSNPRGRRLLVTDERVGASSRASSG